MLHGQLEALPISSYRQLPFPLPYLLSGLHPHVHDKNSNSNSQNIIDTLNGTVDLQCQQTFSASIKLSTHACLTLPCFDTNLYKACDDRRIDHVADGFISVKVVSGKYLTK